MDTRFAAFKTRAEAVSAEVHRFGTREEALVFIQGFLAEVGISEAPECGAVWASGSFIEGAGPQMPGLTYEVTQAACAVAKVGVSQLDWAAADTGSLVQDAAAVEKRLVSTLPPIHVAVLGTDRILADMASVFERLNPSQSNYISFITGPSRTADIERVLTIGAHGPERLVIVVVDAFDQVQA